MKKWAYYDELRKELEAAGLAVNFLPKRPSLLEHLADVRGHRCLVSGSICRCILRSGAESGAFRSSPCTSPWEIHDYGLQKKIVSPLLVQFFYQRGYDHRATTAIGVDEVLSAVMEQLRTEKQKSETLEIRPLSSDLRPLTSDF